VLIIGHQVMSSLHRILSNNEICDPTELARAVGASERQFTGPPGAQAIPGAGESIWLLLFEFKAYFEDYLVFHNLSIFDHSSLINHFKPIHVPHRL
jgi:hypothetical protein